MMKSLQHACKLAIKMSKESLLCFHDGDYETANYFDGQSKAYRDMADFIFNKTELQASKEALDCFINMIDTLTSMEGLRNGSESNL